MLYCYYYVVTRHHHVNNIIWMDRKERESIVNVNVTVAVFLSPFLLAYILLWFNFLLLARYVPNVAKRSIWDQCKKKYILRTDRPAAATSDQRPTTDDRPTNDLTFGKFQMAIFPREVVRSTSCLVLGWGFRGRRIEWRYFRFDQIRQVCGRKQCARSN